MKRRVTVKDIAVKMNCSPSTVSRALSGRPGISETVRTEVRILAMEMGYDFKNTRRKTRNGSNAPQLINIVATRENFIDESFFRKIIWEIEQELYKKNIEIKFTIIDDDRQSLSFYSNRLPFDGMIVIGLVSRKTVTEAVYSGVPVILVDTFLNQLKVDRIRVNNYFGCYEAVTYLMQAGHSRISFLGEVDFSDNMMERYRGCRDCVEQYGGTWVDASGITTLDHSGNINIDLKKLKRLLLCDEPPTAIVCGNDRTAFELYRLLGEIDLTVPDDLSVVGFDNAEKCEYVIPPLTSIDVPKRELAQMAVNFLLERIDDRDKVTSLINLDTNLVVRSSVKKIAPATIDENKQLSANNAMLEKLGLL